MPNKLEERPGNTLHEAMNIILQGQPNHCASTDFLSQEVFARNLYWKKNGDKPTPRQIYLRAKNYPELFEISDDQKFICSISE